MSVSVFVGNFTENDIHMYYTTEINIDAFSSLPIVY